MEKKSLEKEMEAMANDPAIKEDCEAIADEFKQVNMDGIPPADERTTDPVFQNTVNHLWYFWDETWAYLHGPYRTEECARLALVIYAANL